MNKYHQEILREIKKNSGNGTKHSWDGNYLGSDHFHYNLTNVLKRQIAKDFIKKHKGLSFDEISKLLDHLYKGTSYEEKSIAGIFIEYLPEFRKQIDLNLLDKWLECLIGWAEVDSTCQSNFVRGEILDRWDQWEPFMEKLSQDSSISKRRASLVLLTGAVYKNDDGRLSGLAFGIIDQLKSENDILITKAISWLLRDLTYLHKRQVEEYLNKNENTLPKIALRETRKKLLTGRKNG